MTDHYITLENGILPEEDPWPKENYKIFGLAKTLRDMKRGQSFLYPFWRAKAHYLYHLIARMEEDYPNRSYMYRRVSYYSYRIWRMK